MMIVGMWAVVIGYALIYTGTAYFIQGESAPGLAQVFGIGTLQTSSNASPSTTNNAPTASTLAGASALGQAATA